MPASAPAADGSSAEPRSSVLEVRLARNAAEVRAAQALRFRVFYEEMNAKPTAAMAALRRDGDLYDPICDHLLVLDHARGDGPEAIVATYRLIRREMAAKVGGFYSAAEFDLTPLINYPGPILELGRSCVDPAYRSRVAMQLLWRGITAYCFEHDVGVMFGCASIPGTDPQALANQLSYLYHNHLAPEDLRPRALPERYVSMNLLPPEQVDERQALADLPPLVKGYFRLPGFFGDGAVVDYQFNTVDVCVVVKTDMITDRYFRHRDRVVLGEGLTGDELDDLPALDDLAEEAGAAPTQAGAETGRGPSGRDER